MERRDFPNGDNEDGCETAANLITLVHPVHLLWNYGIFALKPIFISRQEDVNLGLPLAETNEKWTIVDRPDDITMAYSCKGLTKEVKEIGEGLILLQYSSHHSDVSLPYLSRRYAECCCRWANTVQMKKAEGFE